jgi:hypothetical protein
VYTTLNTNELKLAQGEVLTTCIQKLTSSNLARDTNYPDVFVVFLSPSKLNVEIPQLGQGQGRYTACDIMNITINTGKTALFEPQPSLEDPARFVIQFSLLWISQQ